jgi:hypothetical protein
VEEHESNIQFQDTHSLPACLNAYDVKLHRLEMPIVILHDHVEDADPESQCGAFGLKDGESWNEGDIKDSSERRQANRGACEECGTEESLTCSKQLQKEQFDIGEDPRDGKDLGIC